MLTLEQSISIARDAADLGDDVAHALLGARTQTAVVTAAILARAAQSLNSATILAGHGFEADAMAVGRTITELLIDLAYILDKDTDDRLKLFLAYEDVQTLKFATGISLLHGGNVDPAAMSVLESRSKAAKALHKPKKDAKKPDVRDWSGCSLAARAEQTGIPHIYGTAYRDACAASHSGAATLRYVAEGGDDPNDEQMYLRWGPGGPSAKPAALAAAGYVSLLRIVFDMMNLPAVLDPFKGRFDTLAAVLLERDGTPVDAPPAQRTIDSSAPPPR